MGRMSNLDLKLRYITRHPDKTWRVWVTYKDFDSEQLYFSFREYGGEAEALAAATSCRDKILKEQGIRLRKYDGNGYCVKHVRCTSGQVGIRCQVQYRKNRNPTADWTAKIQMDGVQKHRAWSIKRYGYVNAWKQAVAYRCAHTGEPIPTAPPPVPEAVLDWAKEFDIDIGPLSESQTMPTKTHPR